MIELETICKTYHEGRPNEVRAVRDVSLSLQLDATHVFKGPSGSGKTTLLSMVGCLARPTTGRIRLNGEVISGLPEKFMTSVRRETFGFIFQRFNVLRGLSVLDNVMVPAFPLGLDYDQLKGRAMDLLSQLNLDHKASMSTELLSGGETQRVAIARALINDPAIVIADEPTANLDKQLTEQFLGIVADLRRAGRCVLMTSHDPRIWQAPIVDQVIGMEDGQIVLIEEKRGSVPTPNAQTHDLVEENGSVADSESEV